MPETTQRIVPNVWCNRNAEEAGAFYARVFRPATSTVGARYPDDAPDWQGEFRGEALTVDVVIDGFLITLVNAADEFAPNPAISFLVNVDPLRYGGDEREARADFDRMWDALVDGGEVLMERDAYPFSARYGWVQDRYGVSWQLILTNPEGEPRPFVIPQLMFCGPAQNRGREAVEWYRSLFEGSRLGLVAEYPEQTGPASAGSVMFGEFQLADQWFAFMDSAVEQPFTFVPGVSLEVRCDDQAEIDRLWGALSAVPEAEQCGWLADRYGVSWQIVPANLAELMTRPNAYEHMMAMKKLVIADF